jgi:hypothetical protein
MSDPSQSNRADVKDANGKRKPSTLRFYGDEFVFDTVSGMFYRVSPTASFILHSLHAGAGVDELANLLQTRYGIDRATAVRDVELLLNDLAALEPLGQLHR